MENMTKRRKPVIEEEDVILLSQGIPPHADLHVSPDVAAYMQRNHLCAWLNRLVEDTNLPKGCLCFMWVDEEGVERQKGLVYVNLSAVPR